MPRDWNWSPTPGVSCCAVVSSDWPYDSGAGRLTPGARLASKRVVGGALDAVGARLQIAVAVGGFDIEQVDERRVRHAGREMAAGADRGDEAGAGERRVGVRRAEVGVRLDLALRDRRLADLLDRPRGERCGVVGELGAGARLGDCAVNREVLERPWRLKIRVDAPFDADAQNRAVAVDDGDDRVVAGGRRRCPGKERADLGRGQGRRRQDLLRGDERRQVPAIEHIEQEPCSASRTMDGHTDFSSDPNHQWYVMPNWNMWAKNSSSWKRNVGRAGLAPAPNVVLAGTRFTFTLVSTMLPGRATSFM